VHFHVKGIFTHLNNQYHCHGREQTHFLTILQVWSPQNYYSFFLKYLFQESCVAWVQTSRPSNPATKFFFTNKMTKWLRI